MHWGMENYLEPIKSEVRTAKELRSLGAQVIIGSHPHVLQPHCYYGNHVVAFSLGNFLFPFDVPGGNVSKQTNKQQQYTLLALDRPPTMVFIRKTFFDFRPRENWGERKRRFTGRGRRFNWDQTKITCTTFFISLTFLKLRHCAIFSGTCLATLRCKSQIVLRKIVPLSTQLWRSV